MKTHKRIAGRSKGFTLIEIMVAMTIGMLGIMIMMQVFTLFLGQKRTTSGAADAQENGLIALYTMERDVRMSGLGLVGLGCTTINVSNETWATPQTTWTMLPVVVTVDNPAVGTDKLVTLYSTSAFANIPTSIEYSMPSTSSILNVSNGDGFVQGNLFLVSDSPPASPPRACTLAEATQDGQKTGSTWNLQHNPSSVWNLPGGHTLFPAGGYGAGARVTNMGSMVNREYYVQNNSLMMRDRTLVDSATNPVALVNGIFAIKALYGKDTTADGYVDTFVNTPAPTAAEEVIAIRLAVVARAESNERESVSPATLVLWSGGTVANGGAIALSASDRQYRYKVYHTTIPLRNIIWGV